MGGVCVSVSLGTAGGVAVLGCRWPCQPRLPRDPPCAKEYEGCIGCKCAAWPGGVKFVRIGVFGCRECACVVVVWDSRSEGLAVTELSDALEGL